MGEHTAISFKNVRKEYPRTLTEPIKVGLEGFSFSHPYGKTLGLIGANGAGKSTSLKLIMDFIRPDEGEITVFGSSPKDQEIRNKVGYLPEIATFPPNLTVLDMLRFAGQSCGIAKQTVFKRSKELLHLLNLWDVRKRQLKKYSKGMQQRANFAVALINKPELLILDEPMSGLDPLGRNAISSLIIDLKKQKKTILFCSHILEDVDKIADMILILHNGQKIYQGSPKELIELRNQNSLTEAYIDLIGENER